MNVSWESKRVNKEWALLILFSVKFRSVFYWINSKALTSNNVCKTILKSFVQSIKITGESSHKDRGNVELDLSGMMEPSQSRNMEETIEKCIW